MLVLLPPSERKAPAPRGGRAPRPEIDDGPLAEPRARVRSALVALGCDEPALRVLGVSAGVLDQVEANLQLPHARTRPAMELFTGVLFDALDWPGLPVSARRRASNRLLVVSALYGVLGPGERAAAHRLSMDVDLPGVGPLAAFWRPHLEPVLSPLVEQRGVLVDCRSAGYAQAWQPRGEAARGGVAVRVLREHDGQRSVVSHLAKHTRGEVTRHLLVGLDAHRRDPRDADDVAGRLSDRWRVELGPADPRGRRLRTLDVVLEGP